MPFPVPASVHATIQQARRPLVALQHATGSYRSWAAAVCAAEGSHARDDFWSCVYRLGFSGLFDRDDGFGGHEVPFRFPHESHACAALNWLSHLQAHEADRCGPWCGGRWDKWSVPRRREWMRRRRYLWSGFLREVERYREARRQFDTARPRDARRGARPHVHRQRDGEHVVRKQVPALG